MNVYIPQFEALHSRGVFYLVFGVLILNLIACSSTSSIGRQSVTTAKRPVSQNDADQASVLRWSNPIHYHGIEVRFEVSNQETDRSARIEAYGYGDRLRSGDLAIAHRFQRFESESGLKYDFEPGSRVFLFRPPTQERPWQTRGDRFVWIWLGDGLSPVIREDHRDGQVTWYFGRSRIKRSTTGDFIYSRRREEIKLAGPITLLIGSQGEILESRSSIK